MGSEQNHKWSVARPNGLHPGGQRKFNQGDSAGQRKLIVQNVLSITKFHVANKKLKIQT